MKTIRSRKYAVGSMVATLLVGVFLTSYFMLLTSTPALAQEVSDPGYLIVCEGPDCDFNSLVTLVVRLINFMIVLSTILATAAFVWAGLKLMTSGGNPGAMKDAKEIFKKVLIGYVWILVAWLLVYTISSALLKEGYFFLGSPK